MFEVLYFPFMFLSGFERVECSEIFATMRLRIHFSAVDTVLSGFEFAYHDLCFLYLLQTLYHPFSVTMF